MRYRKKNIITQLLFSRINNHNKCFFHSVIYSDRFSEFSWNFKKKKKNQEVQISFPGKNWTRKCIDTTQFVKKSSRCFPIKLDKYITVARISDFWLLNWWKVWGNLRGKCRENPPSSCPSIGPNLFWISRSKHFRIQYIQLKSQSLLILIRPKYVVLKSKRTGH